jgi:hypothetical protein
MPREVTGKNQLTPPIFLAKISEGNRNKMSSKLMLLKTGETIITDAKELVSDEVILGYVLINPHYVEAKEKLVLTESKSGKSNYEIDVILTPWLILSKDKQFVVSKDYIATICDPIETVEKMYREKTGSKLEVTETEVNEDE